MKDDKTTIAYYEGIFDKYKTNPDLNSWLDYPDLMWGLGFDMDCGESYRKYIETCGITVKEPKNKREEKRNILYILEHAPKQIVGNFLFSHWRFLTHWLMYGYSEYDVDFIMRIIKILEDKYAEEDK